MRQEAAASLLLELAKSRTRMYVLPDQVRVLWGAADLTLESFHFRDGLTWCVQIWSSTPDPRLPYRPKITSRRHRQTRSLPRGTRSSAQRNPSPRALSTPPNTSSLLPRRRDRRSHGCSQNGRHRSPRPRGDLDHSMGYDRATAHTCSRKLLLRLVSSRAGRDQFQINAMQ